MAENVAAQVLAIASACRHLLFPATAHGKSTAPRVAARLDVAQLSDVTKVLAPDTFERPIYAGNAIATVQSADVVETIPAVADSGKSALVGREVTRSDRPELPPPR